MSQPSSVDWQVMDQYAPMKTMLTFSWSKDRMTPRTTFYNYLTPEVENFEEKDFQTFANDAVKLLSGIQSRTEERDHQPEDSIL